jgi:hypothetical protein
MKNKIYILISPENFEEIYNLEYVCGIDIDDGRFVVKITYDDNIPYFSENVQVLGTDLEFITQAVKILRAKKNEEELLQLMNAENI